MNPCHLLDLPFVPLTNIAKRLEMSELLAISTDPMFYRAIGIKSKEIYIEISHLDWWVCGRPEIVFGLGGDPCEELKQLLFQLPEIQRAFPGQYMVLFLSVTHLEELLNDGSLPKEVHILGLQTDRDHNSRELLTERLYPYHDTDEEVEKMKEKENMFIERLMSQMKIHDGLILSGPGRPQTERAFDIKYLKVEYSDWIYEDELSRLQNQVVYLNRTELSDRSMNTFFKEFKTGRICQNLEVLTVMGFYKDPDWNPEIVMEQVGFKNDGKEEKVFLLEKPNGLQNDFYPPRLEVDLTNAYNFIRDDGIKCSVVFRKQKILTLYVWKEGVFKPSEEEEGRKRKATEEETQEVKRRLFDPIEEL